MKKSVLITGVSGGIGQAVAQEFARNGYNIIATYNTHEISNKLRDFCAEKGVKLVEYQLDIADSKQVAEVFEKAFNEDYLDCVVCNAGCSIGEKMLCDHSDEDIEKLIQTNLVGTIYCNREASRQMLKQKHGNIINISSIYGVNGGSCESVYSACKAGIIGLTKALAKELAESSLRVNAIAPGYVETNMTAHFTEEEKDAIRREGELKISTPEDVAKVVYSVVNSTINGEVVFID
ncbi:MAG: SDR family NAD(P)-dependent oxidoreductase [Clostridia bacterium]|nr:SDR family NAD(P)-dependent oxidoreductase [Clostridia bacterium]MBQ8792327.1 SDR family NAD(P)-dependent oxidoreductase [Clostridia bacterium]